MKSCWQNTFPRRKTQYRLGKTPCGNCKSLGKHDSCRPTLAGELCSCSCPAAINLRAEVDAQRASAELHGRPEPDLKTAVAFLRPNYTPGY